jgi:4,5:9,10-diseco-3-hydroxy-5,9,17-trioxoandrosta-1(10),2-diene-4-oate hydrolase
VRVGPHEVTYLTAGEGPPVVLLHGFGGWSEVVWSRVIPALAARYTVIAPDIVGFGLSSKPEADFFMPGDPLASEVQSLAEFLDNLDVGHAHLVGNSFGGGLALRLADQYPERCDKLVLVNSMGLGRSIHYVYKALAMPWLGQRLLKPDRFRIRRMWNILVADPKLVTDEIVERNYELLSEPGAAEVLAAARFGVDLIGQKLLYTELLSRVEQPTLVLWGKEDRIFPLRHAERAVKLLPHGELAVLDGVGHIPPFEAPERFSEAVLAFLAREETGASAPGLASASG